MARLRKFLCFMLFSSGYWYVSQRAACADLVLQCGTKFCNTSETILIVAGPVNAFCRCMEKAAAYIARGEPEFGSMAYAALQNQPSLLLHRYFCGCCCHAGD